MKKNIAVWFLPLLLLACTSKQTNFIIDADSDDTSYLADVEGCPKVHIRPANAVITQSDSLGKIFKVSIAGYQGYCYTNEKNGKYKAVVKPRFEIERLNDSDVTDVHISYYLETVEGPTSYLGRKTYFTTVSVPQEAQFFEHVAQGGELSIPPSGTYNNDLYLGLKTDRFDLEEKYTGE